MSIPRGPVAQSMNSYPVKISLENIPADVVELIAYHAVAITPLGPPSVLIPLLSSCRSINSSLCFLNNPSLYASIFRLKFDAAAPIRRLGSPHSLSSISLALELQRRFLAIQRMRKAVLHRRISSTEQEFTRDLWTIYLMCLESDGKNATQLYLYARLQAYVNICIDQDLVSCSLTPGYSEDTTERSLIFWLAWFTTSWESLSQEAPDYEDIMIDMLRPIVFANFEYNCFFAPWIYHILPTQQAFAADSPSPIEVDDVEPLNSHYAADITLCDRSCIVAAYDGHLRLTPPLMVHAALLLYFARLGKQPIAPSSSSHISSAERDPSIRRTARNVRLRFAHLRNSRVYDGDFIRMQTCLDPRSSLPNLRYFRPGMFSGDWEGRFAFTDFDNFRDMLDGDIQAIRGATVAQQPQVWSINEHRFPSRRRYSRNIPGPEIRTPPHPSASPPIEQSHPLPTGPALKGHLPPTVRFEQEDASYPTKYSPDWTHMHTDKDNIYPTSRLHAIHTNQSGQLVDSIYDTYDGTYASPEGQLPPRDGEDEDRSWADPYGFSGYTTTDTEHENPDPRFEDEDEEYGGGDAESFDVIITGKGHSAWGPFLLQGRVRTWDGMIHVLKTYAGDDVRGNWLYRGYIVGDGLWIGRWRDTLTEEATNGYEGVFAMTRRS